MEDRTEKRLHQVVGVLRRRRGVGGSSAFWAVATVARGEECGEDEAEKSSHGQPLQESISRRWTSAGRSCWHQWPAPSRMWLPRRPGKVFGKEFELRLRRREAQHTILAAGDEERGWRIGWPRHGQPSSQLRRRLRYQFQPPRKPVRGIRRRSNRGSGFGEPGGSSGGSTVLPSRVPGGEPGEAFALLVSSPPAVCRSGAARRGCPAAARPRHAGLLEILQVEVVDPEACRAPSGYRT